MSSPGGVSVTEVQVTCTQPRTLTKKLDITCHSPQHPQQQPQQPLSIVFQGQTIDGLTYSWKLDPPKLIAPSDVYTIKAKTYRKRLGISIPGPHAKFESSQFVDAFYSSKKAEWTKDLGDGLSITFRLVAHAPITSSIPSAIPSSSPPSTSTLNRKRSAISSAGTIISSISQQPSKASTTSTSTSPSSTSYSPNSMSPSFGATSSATSPSSSVLPLDPDASLPSTTDELLTICPQFRILVIGKSGVGKSSLINRIFGVDKATVSDTLPGSSNIDHEITSSANKRFVLHDSQGFEQGESRNLEVVKEFVERRRRMPHLKDRLHAIWLCAQIPTTGGRVFESGDAHFLSGLGLNNERSVPVIVVFTKFDLLVRYVDFELDEEEDADVDAEAEGNEEAEVRRRKVIMERVDGAFKQECVGALHRVARHVPYVRVSTNAEYQYSLEELVSLTFDLVSKRERGIISLTTGIAQRISPNVKLSTSVAVGKQRYWLAILASTDFPGRKLSACLDVIHKDLVTVWNFQDPNQFLLSDSVKAAMRQLIADTITQSSTRSTGSSVSVPTVMGAGVANWVSRVYVHSQETIRCLMTYIVDLTLIMKLMFLDQHRYHTVDPLIFRDYFDQYQLSGARVRNHEAIRGFVVGLGLRERAGQSERVVRKIEELVWAGGEGE